MADRGNGVFIGIGFFGSLIGGFVALISGEPGVGWIFLIVGAPGAILIGSLLGIGPSARSFFGAGVVVVVVAITYLTMTSAMPGRAWWPF
ncbi:MAG: hypothetical protein O7C63_07030 [Alphaproteobacteria bacterium]|nr:hypothetical protein [Alphaproteobacteria bacterium]